MIQQEVQATLLPALMPCISLHVYAVCVAVLPDAKSCLCCYIYLRLFCVWPTASVCYAYCLCYFMCCCMLPTFCSADPTDVHAECASDASY
ncbi:hypothetical protein CMV_022466 [Castanea mollissima]|uniref:Uncharacterized protein n=1 Tax=Castanea mollissima TaxID=60419 RepID=A0A8J4QJI7_9ROSI|nr:hypothetical protein CMV_022466 [Castanea mollissima]